jgi:hypothetical protein
MVWPPELEFGNKMPNRGILESRDLRLGDIHRFPSSVSKNCFKPQLRHLLRCSNWQHSKLL